ACAAAARQERRAVLARQRNRPDHLLNRFWDHDSDGHLAIVGAVYGIQGAGAVVEANFAGDDGAHLRSHRLRCRSTPRRLGWTVQCRGHGLDCQCEWRLKEVKQTSTVPDSISSLDGWSPKTKAGDHARAPKYN